MRDAVKEILMGVLLIMVIIGIAGFEGCIKNNPESFNTEMREEAVNPPESPTTTYECPAKVIYIIGDRVTVVDEAGMEWEFYQAEGEHKEGQIVTIEFDTNGTPDIADDIITNVY